MIDFYTAPTPNGHKASCTLEALEMPPSLGNLLKDEEETEKFASNAQSTLQI